MISNNPEDFDSVVEVVSDISDSFVDLHASLGRMRRDFADLQLRYGQACLSIETDAILKSQCARTFFSINFDFAFECFLEVEC